MKPTPATGELRSAGPGASSPFPTCGATPTCDSASTAAWLGWGEELYAAGITISDFEVAFCTVKEEAQGADPSLDWLDELPT